MTSLSADDSLLSHYGFSHDPFAARVPGFKFFPAQRKPVLGQLHHLARYSQLLLVVTGPEGSGKTLVRQALVASSNKQSVQSVVVTPQSTMDSNLVLQQIAQALGSARADFDSIMAQIIQLALTGQEIYLLVDDAERLTGAAVETLLRLAEGSPEGRPHVFLFGEESLLARLEALVDGEERFHAIALQPYEEDETREYLSLRLEGAGSGLECLTEEQIVRIHEQSGGWPGGINQAAREELIDAMHHSRAKRKSNGWFPLPIKHLLALLAVLCIVAIALFIMRDGVDEQPAAPATTSLPLGTGAVEPVPAQGTPGSGESEESSLPATSPEPQTPLVREPLAAAGSADIEDFPLQEAPPTVPAPVAEQPRDRVEQPAGTASAVAPSTVAPQPVAPAPAPAPAPAKDYSFLSAVEREILTVTNRHRAANGLPALVWDDTLYNSSRDHSATMFLTNNFAHTTKYNVGENIYMLASADRSKYTAEFIVQKWMDSPGHRANILNPRATRMAAGVLTGTQYFPQHNRELPTLYATQHFR